MANISSKDPNRMLVAFIRSYTDLQEKQLASIQQSMRETVDGVMQGIMEISDKTAAGKRKANEVLVKTYTDPDAEAKKSIDDVQDEVSKVFEAAQREVVEAAEAKKLAANAPAASGDAGAGSAVLQDKLRRTAGIFSKHMEALDSLDGELQQLLLAMMGQLSRDDVVTQRIEHVSMALQALQTSLTYILMDYESRCRQGDVERCIADLKSYVVRSYTMEDERRAFHEVFPEDLKVPKAS